jgi:hypothetical protein
LIFVKKGQNRPSNSRKMPVGFPNWLLDSLNGTGPVGRKDRRFVLRRPKKERTPDLPGVSKATKRRRMMSAFERLFADGTRQTSDFLKRRGMINAIRARRPNPCDEGLQYGAEPFNVPPNGAWVAFENHDDRGSLACGQVIHHAINNSRSLSACWIAINPGSLAAWRPDVPPRPVPEGRRIRRHMVIPIESVRASLIGNSVTWVRWVVRD